MPFPAVRKDELERIYAMLRAGGWEELPHPKDYSSWTLPSDPLGMYYKTLEALGIETVRQWRQGILPGGEG